MKIRKYTLSILVVAVAAAIVGCGGSGETNATAIPLTTASTAGNTTGTQSDGTTNGSVATTGSISGPPTTSGDLQ